MRKVILYFAIPLGCLVLGYCDGSQDGYERGREDEAREPKRCTIIELQNCPCESKDWQAEKLPEDE